MPIQKPSRLPYGLKVYGWVRTTAEKRFARRHYYYAVRRDKKGRFMSFRKWSQYQRTEKPKYVQKSTLKEEEVTTHREMKEKASEFVEEEMWVDKAEFEYLRMEQPEITPPPEKTVVRRGYYYSVERDEKGRFTSFQSWRDR